MGSMDPTPRPANRTIPALGSVRTPIFTVCGARGAERAASPFAAPEGPPVRLVGGEQLRSTAQHRTRSGILRRPGLGAELRYLAVIRRLRVSLPAAPALSSAAT